MEELAHGALLVLGGLEACLGLGVGGVDTGFLDVNPRVVGDVVGIRVVLGVGEGPRLYPAYQLYLAVGEAHVGVVEGGVDDEPSAR